MVADFLPLTEKWWPTFFPLLKSGGQFFYFVTHGLSSLTQLLAPNLATDSTISLGFAWSYLGMPSDERESLKFAFLPSTLTCCKLSVTLGCSLAKRCRLEQGWWGEVAICGADVRLGCAL